MVPHFEGLKPLSNLTFDGELITLIVLALVALILKSCKSYCAKPSTPTALCLYSMESACENEQNKTIHRIWYEYVAHNSQYSQKLPKNAKYWFFTYWTMI